MLASISPLTLLRKNLRSGVTNPFTVAEQSILAANGSVSKNTYLDFHPAALRRQATSLLETASAMMAAPLYGVPVSLKDCFDLAGTVTTCGSSFYARESPASTDSALAQALKASGALVTGKTHLHPLAYGITGQNATFGDSLQPRDPQLLTGGSSSGAAASVQEESALVGLGTDTGGSIRVPAALCGLVGYRASQELAYAPGPFRTTPEGLWQGAAHLAKSFDTLGFLLRDPRDAALVANALFAVPIESFTGLPRIGRVPFEFLDDAEPDVLAAYEIFLGLLGVHFSTIEEVDVAFWEEAREIFFPIQAAEASLLHAGHFEEFDPAIGERLRWGASLGEVTLKKLRGRLSGFESKMAELFRQFDFLILPCAPVSRLVAAEDQSASRNAILRYTTPFSLARVPVVALPGELLGASFGTGLQIAAAPGRDGSLLALAAALGSAIAA